MRATIPARKLKIHEAQTVAMAAATQAVVTLVAAIREAVVAIPAAATRVGVTRAEGIQEAVEDPVVDQTMAAGTLGMTKKYKR
jgi:hypothetical protein